MLVHSRNRSWIFISPNLSTSLLKVSGAVEIVIITCVPTSAPPFLCKQTWRWFSKMFAGLRRRFLGFWSRLRSLMRRHRRHKLVVKGLKKLHSKLQRGKKQKFSSKNDQNGLVKSHALEPSPIRLATFNTALFSLAPAVPKADKSMALVQEEEGLRPSNGYAKGILKQQSSLQPTSENARSKPKVSINLPENEISLAQKMGSGLIDDYSSKLLSFKSYNHAPVRSPLCFPSGMPSWLSDAGLIGSTTIFDVLKQVDADILTLQDVKAVEEEDMRPLSDLAHALGMNYVFAESWAPEYGNAVLSKWPIKRWKLQKICDDKDFRNVLKATIDVPGTGELNVYCTQLDHLDENWRMKQINKIIESNDQPHVLAGGLNSLDASDYSLERWNDIVKYYEELGKPTPKVEVTSFLKERQYTDAKSFQGDCEPLVMIAKGQNVQGTCKYGTRVDYILGSQGLDYTFVPGSYSVYSSKGTSDHHVVKVDIVRAANGDEKCKRRQMKLKQRVDRQTTYRESSSVSRLY